MQNNSSRTSLFLMELIISIFFFSLAGAVCVQLFVRSHTVSKNSVELNHSVLWAQNTAEVFYGCNGNINEMANLLSNCVVDDEDEDKQSLFMFFDKNFDQMKGPEVVKAAPSAVPVYRLNAVLIKESDLITCHITVANVEDANAAEIYALDATLFPDKEAVHE